MKKAIYAGSFDPFTNGHLDILKQALDIFEYVIIILADNSAKQSHYPSLHMSDAIIRTLDDLGYVKRYHIVISNDLIADIARDCEVDYLIRGLRNPVDYNYEENIAKINKEINPNLNTIYFRANNEVISSSMVRELYRYGKDVSMYVPPYVLDVMKRKSKVKEVPQLDEVKKAITTIKDFCDSKECGECPLHINGIECICLDENWSPAAWDINKIKE
jgi:pantetheine-phosphate adenylyltransferase